MDQDPKGERTVRRFSARALIAAFVVGAATAIFVVKMVPAARHSLGLIDQSPIQDAAEALKGIFANGALKDTKKGEVTKLEWDRSFDKEGRLLRVEQASISRPMRAKLLDEPRPHGEDVLLFVVRVKNATDRKILKGVGSVLAWKKPKLTDDAGNDLGFLADLYEELVANEDHLYGDMDPGQEVTLHLPFRLPIAGTRSLSLSFDLRFVDLEGTVEFQVPATGIAGYGR